MAYTVRIILGIFVTHLFIACNNAAQGPNPAGSGAGAPGPNGAAGNGGASPASAATGPLCKYNVQRADPGVCTCVFIQLQIFYMPFIRSHRYLCIDFKDIFDAKCASCVSRAMVQGLVCYHNGWMRVTTCSCTSWIFDNCKCARVMSNLSWFIFIFCPALCILMMVGAKTCLKYPACPLYSLEKRYQVYQKIKRKKLQKEKKTKDTSSNEDSDKSGKSDNSNSSDKSDKSDSSDSNESDSS